MKNNRQFIQIQLSLFFSENFSEQVEKISLKIKDVFGVDLNPQILGIPDNAPSEIPRIVVNSTLLNISLAKNRLDIFSPNENFLQDSFEKIVEIIESSKVKINRIGHVTTFFKEDAFEDLFELFDRSKFDEKFLPKEINLRFNEEKEFSIGKINNSQTYEVGSMIGKDGEIKEGVLITRDINTLIGSKNSYNYNEIEKFISEAETIKFDTLI